MRMMHLKNRIRNSESLMQQSDYKMLEDVGTYLEASIKIPATSLQVSAICIEFINVHKC
jgi:hypothetical protein